MRPVRMEPAGKDAEPSALSLAPAVQPCPVAKQNACRPVFPVEDLEKLSAPMTSAGAPGAAEHRISHVERIDKTGTYGLDVEGNGIWAPIWCCTLVAVDGNVSSGVLVAMMIRSISAPPYGLARPVGGITSQIGRLFAIGDNVALRDAGALTYPLVAGIHHSGKVMVAHDPLRQVSANRNHERPAVRHLLFFSRTMLARAMASLTSGMKP